MFTCDTYQLDGLKVVAVAGDVDLATADRLWSTIAQHLAISATVVVDCARIEFIDSTGLQALLRARLMADTLGADFALAATPPAVTRVLELAGVDGLFTVHQAVEHVQVAGAQRAEPKSLETQL